MRETLTPRERIRKKKDFLVLYKKGNRYRGRYFNLVYLPNHEAFSRMAVVVSKKVGNAVTRNRVKRWTRDLFRRNKDLLEKPLDLILVAKKDILEASWAVYRQEYFSALKYICRK